MGTNKQLLSKGIKYLAGALPLFIGPSLIYTFMNQQNVWHYLILAIGIVACLAAMFYMYMGLKNYNEKFI
jgi:small neutral amino acid transporter SnatA (MarC family)